MCPRQQKHVDVVIVVTKGVIGFAIVMDQRRIIVLFIRLSYPSNAPSISAMLKNNYPHRAPWGFTCPSIYIWSLVENIKGHWLLYT